MSSFPRDALDEVENEQAEAAGAEQTIGGAGGTGEISGPDDGERGEINSTLDEVAGMEVGGAGGNPGGNLPAQLTLDEEGAGRSVERTGTVGGCEQLPPDAG